MTKDDTRKLSLGIYRLHWKEGGCSIAAVGQLHDGTRWFAPTNWTVDNQRCFGGFVHGVASVKWGKVQRAEEMRVVP